MTGTCSNAEVLRLSPWLPLVALLLLAWLTPTAQAQEPPPPLDPTVAEGLPIVAVRGLERFPVFGRVQTRVARPGEDPILFSRIKVADDLLALLRTGYFGPGPNGEPPVAYRVVPEQGGVAVEFTVYERSRVVQIQFIGFGDLDEDDYEPLISAKQGERVDRWALFRDRRELEALLVQEGYLYASVSVTTEPTQGGVNVIYRVDAGQKVYVDEIEYRGVEHLEDEDGLEPDVLDDVEGPDANKTKPRSLWGLLEEGRYDPEAFDQDLANLTRYYRSKGFLDCRVYKVSEQLDPAGEALTLVVKIEPGPRYRVRRLAIEGNRVVSEEQIGAAIARADGIRPGRPFLGNELEAARTKIRNLYGQRAYVHAAVGFDVRYDYERNLVDIVLQVSEGPKVRLERVRIEGNDKTQEKVIRRELSFYPGEYFDSRELQASQQRLGRLRYFRDVRFDFEPGTQVGSEDLVIRVEEERTGSFVLGGGVSTGAGFFGNISLTQRNFDITDLPRSFRDFFEGTSFTGAGQTLNISLQPGGQRSQFSVTFTEPWLFDYPVIFTVEGALRDRVREDWLESRRLARISLGYRITPDWIIQARYRIERVRVAEIDLDALPDVIRVAGSSYVGAMRFLTRFDQTVIDRYFVAYAGYAVEAYYEVASEELGSEYNFQRAGAEATWQLKTFSFPGDFKWVIGLRSQIDWQRPFGDTDEVPIFERFFAGGPNSHRGFEFRTVTPQTNDKPEGGDFRILASLEYSFPLFQDILRGVVFSDAGGVTATIGDLEGDDIRLAAGFGFRVKIPVFPAPVALDFAWPLRERDTDDTQVFSFSVGFNF